MGKSNNVPYGFSKGGVSFVVCDDNINSLAHYSGHNLGAHDLKPGNSFDDIDVMSQNTHQNKGKRTTAFHFNYENKEKIKAILQ